MFPDGGQDTPVRSRSKSPPHVWSVCVGGGNGVTDSLPKPKINRNHPVSRGGTWESCRDTPSVPFTLVGHIGHPFGSVSPDRTGSRTDGLEGPRPVPHPLPGTPRTHVPSGCRVVVVPVSLTVVLGVDDLPLRRVQEGNAPIPTSTRRSTLHAPSVLPRSFPRRVSVLRDPSDTGEGDFGRDSGLSVSFLQRWK